MNAEGGNVPSLGRRCGQQNGLVERFGVLNDVVGWHHQHECRGILLGQAKGSQSHSRCCVTALVFQNECGGNDAQWLALRRHNEAVGLVAHQNGSRRAQNGLRAHQSGLKQGVFTVQSQQLFGVAFARHGPQTRTASPGQDHRMDAGWTACVARHGHLFSL